MKMKLSFFFFLLIFCFSSFAFMVECKGISNSKLEARFIQQTPDLPLLSQINNFMIYHLKMTDAEISKDNFKVNFIRWKNEEKDIFLYLDISNETLNDQNLGKPWVYKSRLYLGGTNHTAIDNVEMMCRTFFL